MSLQKAIGALQKVLPEGSVLLEEPLARHTTFKIGGPAAAFVEADSAETVRAVLAIVREYDVPFCVLGRGSNVLAADEGDHGIILHIGNRFSNIRIDEMSQLVTAEAGTLLSSVSQALTKAELSGFEFAAGIPGTVGGAVFMNAGAYGGEMKDILKEVSVMRSDGTVAVLSREALALGYRDSLLQHEPLILLTATFQLRKGAKEEIIATVQDLAERRATKQPLEFPSAGSVFKRPVGHFAGGLIEEAGLKGYRIGGAEVSEKHAGFIINRGGATAGDVLALVRYIQTVVEEKSGVHLEPELKVLTSEPVHRS